MEEQTQPQVVTPTPAAPQKKSGGNCLSMALIGCIVFIICFICCAVVGVAAFNASVGTALSKFSNVEAINKLCSANDSDLLKFYTDQTTRNFREKYTMTEFKNLYEQNKNVLGNCDKLKNVNVLDSLSKGGISFNYETKDGQEKLSVGFTVEGKKITASLVTENDQLKLDDLTVQ